MCLPYDERRRLLEALDLHGPAWQTPQTFTDGRALLHAVHEQGLEGVVAKRRDSSYRPGERGWIKTKNPPLLAPRPRMGSHLAQTHSVTPYRRDVGRSVAGFSRVGPMAAPSALRGTRALCGAHGAADELTQLIWWADLPQ